MELQGLPILLQEGTRKLLESRKVGVTLAFEKGLEPTWGCWKGPAPALRDGLVFGSVHDPKVPTYQLPPLEQ